MDRFRQKSAHFQIDVNGDHMTNIPIERHFIHPDSKIEPENFIMYSDIGE